MSFLSSLIGPVIGAFAGGGDDTQTTTSTSTPWGAAQPYMLRNMEDTEKLGNYYKQNPFNRQQTESYSNLFNDNNNFRNNIAPGLMNFANQGMSSNYQRATGGRPGDGAGYGGARQPGGRSGGVSGGLLGASSGPFSVAQSGGQPSGLLDLNGAQNPFRNGSITQAPETVDEQMISELKAAIEGGLGNSPGNDSDNGPSGGTTSAFNTNAPEAAWLDSIIPGLSAAYNAAMRNGFNASPDFMSTPASVNAYSAARAQRQEGAGDYGGGDYGGGYTDGANDGHGGSGAGPR